MSFPSLPDPGIPAEHNAYRHEQLPAEVTFEEDIHFKFLNFTTSGNTMFTATELDEALYSLVANDRTAPVLEA